jgi:hypothetical protein
MNYCIYYQAHIPKATAWHFVGILRSYEHLAFERTADKAQSIFEFLVPHDMEQHFLELMQVLGAKGLIVDLRQMPHRYLAEVQG